MRRKKVDQAQCETSDDDSESSSDSGTSDIVWALSHVLGSNLTKIPESKVLVPSLSPGSAV